MRRGMARLSIVSAVALGTICLTSAASADPSCTGVTAKSNSGPGFGSEVVAPTAQDANPNFGQQVISPEAKTKCPEPTD